MEQGHNIEDYLPANPEPGQIATLPEGVIGGESTRIILLSATKTPIGETMYITKVRNVSFAWNLSRTFCSEELKLQALITVRVEKAEFTSMQFVEYVGWIGYGTADPEIISDDTYEIVGLSNITGMSSLRMYVYEAVGLKNYKEQKNEQPQKN